MKIALVYWSGTGNTEKMATLIEKGIKEAGKEVSAINVSDTNVDDVASSDIIILGCPAMGGEVLEEGEFEPFNSSLMEKISGKKVALFGSYDWGDGQWMRDWEEQVKGAGGSVVCDSLIVNLMPEGSSEEECVDFGKKVANA